MTYGANGPRAIVARFWRAVNGVVERASIMPEHRHIAVPTLIMVGDEDMATVPRRAEQIHAAIRGSELARIPRAGHSSSIEGSVHVTVAIEAWIGRAQHV